MQVSYGEGVAIHAGPELCVASRKAGGEALAGVRAGQVFSPENTTNGVPTPSRKAEGYTLSIVIARGTGTPRGPRPCACAEAPRTQTGRSQVSPTAC
jgi:hypothetical protein